MPESPGSNPQDAQPRPPRGIMPPVLVDLLVPAAKVGALTGGMGAIGGAAAGILKESHPVVYGLAYSIQCFALGSTFWLSRSVAVQGWGGEHNLTPRDRLKVSSIGGAVAGTVNGLTRGPRHIIPSTIIWTVFGVAGQGVVNKVNGWKGQKTGSEETSWLSSKWSPLRKLSDQEYEDFMSEKMLKVEAEIALIDDKIAELREEERVKQGGKAQAVPQEAEKPQKSSWWRWS